jgi:hypothetical protein
VKRARQAFHAAYGESPVQLVLLLASFAVALLAARHVYQADPKHWWRYAIWFVGAALAHDLLLFPVYSTLDRVLRLVPRPRMTAATVNYVRVPAVLSGFLLLTFLPAITKGGQVSFGYAAAQTQDGIFLHWVIVTAVLFAASGLVYAVRRLRS